MKDKDIPSLPSIQALVNTHIKVTGGRSHSKASEEYIDVEFYYPDEKLRWVGSVPIEYRRTGISVRTEKDIASLLNKVYSEMHPNHIKGWLEEQKKFWDESNKEITRPFFEVLKDFKWKCVHCELPKNPNWARRFQDIKEFGYTTATNTRMFCKTCNKNTTHLILLPINRGNQTGYENWSPKLRKRIMEVLENYDAYEDRQNKSLLPDHKFPEIRWDKDTKEENDEDMLESDIINKFQLITNQRNQQKREVCRRCYQTGKRGFPFGIKFYYHGKEDWPEDIPRKGKSAEKGCIGCGWYDLKKWREEINKIMS